MDKMDKEKIKTLIENKAMLMCSEETLKKIEEGFKLEQMNYLRTKNELNILPSEVEIENGKVSEKFLLDFLVKVANAKDEKIAEWANNLPFSEIEKLLNPDYFVKTFSVVYFNHDLSGRGYFFPFWYFHKTSSRLVGI
jgi:hypothetical protein